MRVSCYNNCLAWLVVGRWYYVVEEKLESLTGFKDYGYETGVSAFKFLTRKRDKERKGTGRVSIPQIENTRILSN